jgi:Flp pilus assembly protein TadG
MKDRRSRSQRGASALEFGLVAPVILLMVFGIIQYGYLYWSLQTAKATAREAARQLIVGTDWGCTEQQALAKVAMPAVGGAVPSVVATYVAADGVTAATAPGVPGGLVRVEVSFQTLDMHLPFVPVPHGAQVTQRVTARIENVPPTPLTCS